MSEKGSRTRAVVERSYTQLKDMILCHRVAPGQRLQDRDLAEELGVSRTPIREALSRLERDGLVVNQEGRGYYVRRIDPDQIAHLYNLRELLETEALCLAVKNAKPEDVRELAKTLATMERLEQSPDRRSDAIRLGIKFHEIFARASGNPFLHEMMKRLLDQLLFCIWTEAWLETAVEAEATRREHRAYLALLQEKTARKARQIVRTHVRRSKHQFLKIFKARESFYAPTGIPHATFVPVSGGPEPAARPGRTRKLALE